MQLAERILTKCSSNGSSPVKALFPAVLGAVVDHQPHHHNQQQQLTMAHSAAMLLSPTKRPLFCSNGSASSSPARPTPMVLSPAAAAPPAKRPLAALQCCPSSSNPRLHQVAAFGQPHTHQKQQQQHLHTSTAAEAAAANGSENEAPMSQAFKRLEVAQGLSSSSSSSSKPRQPVTPAISQPQPLASLQPPHLGTPAAAGATPAHAAADSSLAHLASATAAAGAAATWPAAAGVLLRSDDDGRPVADQLPSPCTILEVPPALTAAAASSAPSSPSAAASAGSALQDDIADVQQHKHHQQHHQQHQQQRDVAAGPQPSPQHVPPHMMSGRRLDRRYDIPVNLGFLDGYVDHAPALGSGRLDVILGPMFAGKTTALLKRLGEVVGGRPFICVKSSKDTRYSDHWIMTHGGGCVRCLPFHSLAEFKAHMSFRWHKIQVIAIDEAQFFPDLVEFCQEAVDNDGKHVIVAGLSGDFRRRRFGQVLDLMPLADTVQQLRSICSVCGGKHGDGLFSLRKVQAGPQEVVGGDEAYMATCRRCYLEHGGQLQ